MTKNTNKLSITNSPAVKSTQYLLQISLQYSQETINYYIQHAKEQMVFHAVCNIEGDINTSTHP
jgi:hypothetical protein